MKLLVEKLVLVVVCVIVAILSLTVWWIHGRLEILENRLANSRVTTTAPAASFASAVPPQNPVNSERTARGVLGVTLNVEDMTGQRWELKDARLEYYGGGIRCGPDRFQSQKEAADKQRTPLFVRFGQVDLLIALDDLVSLERRAEDKLTFKAIYYWQGKRQDHDVDLLVPEESYAKYDVVGTTSDNKAVTLPTAKLKRLAIARQAEPRTTVPLSFSATIELSNGGQIPVANIQRVSQSSPYCFHQGDLVYKKGSSKVEVPLERLKSIVFGPIPHAIQITYLDSKVDTGTLERDKDEILGDNFVGFSGFSNLGEVFVWAVDVQAVRFQPMP